MISLDGKSFNIPISSFSLIIYHIHLPLQSAANNKRVKVTRNNAELNVEPATAQHSSPDTVPSHQVPPREYKLRCEPFDWQVREEFK